MSDGTAGQREWRLYVDDRIAFAEKGQAYTRDFDQTAFVDDALTYDATLRNLELILKLLVQQLRNGDTNASQASILPPA